MSAQTLKSAAMLILLISTQPASAWWEAASTWDPKRGRYVSTEDYKKEHGVKEVCQSTSCWDGGHFRGRDDWNKRQELRERRRHEEEK